MDVAMSRDLSVFTNYVEDSYLLSTVYQIYLSIGKYIDLSWFHIAVSKNQNS